MIAYPANKDNASYDIPAGVSSIEDNAFTGCTNLESITIPNSVTTIGSYAFSDCSSLTSIFLPGSLGASIPDTTTQINYTINDEKVTIISIVLGEGQTSFDIPDTICGVSVAAVAADHQSKVGNHTHNWDSKDTCLLCGTVQLENVSIAITEPKATEALAEEASVSTEGVAADPIIWQPSHTNAGYNKVYTARVTLSANTGYMYADSVTVKVNNSDVNSSNITKNEDGTITVRYQFAATDKRTLTASDFTFTAPADLVYNGNAKAATVTAKPSGVGNITVKYYC